MSRIVKHYFSNSAGICSDIFTSFPTKNPNAFPLILKSLRFISNSLFRKLVLFSVVSVNMIFCSKLTSFIFRMPVAVYCWSDWTVEEALKDMVGYCSAQNHFFPIARSSFLSLPIYIVSTLTSIMELSRSADWKLTAPFSPWKDPSAFLVLNYIE